MSFWEISFSINAMQISFAFSNDGDTKACI